VLISMIARRPRATRVHRRAERRHVESEDRDGTLQQHGVA
jgi:hypothetical protein